MFDCSRKFVRPHSTRWQRVFCQDSSPDPKFLTPSREKARGRARLNGDEPDRNPAGAGTGEAGRHVGVRVSPIVPAGDRAVSNRSPDPLPDRAGKAVVAAAGAECGGGRYAIRVQRLQLFRPPIPSTQRNERPSLAVSGHHEWGLIRIKKQYSGEREYHPGDSCIRLARWMNWCKAGIPPMVRLWQACATPPRSSRLR